MEESRALLNELGSADWWVRRNAIKGLLAQPEEVYLPFIEEALRNQSDATLRNAAMEFYRALGIRSLQSLVRLLSHYEDEEVRLFSANILGDIKDRKAVPALIEALKDADVNVRIASAEALGKIGDPVSLGALTGMLDDEPWVAMAAIKAIGDIGGEDSLCVLYNECLTREEYLGITFEAIERAGNYHSIRCLTPYVEQEEMRELALKAIVNIAEREGTRPQPGYFINLVPLLIELQGSARPELKRAALIALTWSEDLRGLQYFIDALGIEGLEEYAISGIIGIGKKAVPSVIDALKDTARVNRCVMAKLLSMMAEHMALMRFSGDEDPEVRVEVALSMGHIASPRAVEILSKMLNDPEDEVKIAAHKALENLNRII